MTIPHEYSIASMVWIALVSAVLGIILAVVTVATFSGRLDARVAALEKASEQAVPRGEWRQFEKDLISRLDRIETKLDQHIAK
jgi:hypothetical protein